MELFVSQTEGISRRLLLSRVLFISLIHELYSGPTCFDSCDMIISHVIRCLYPVYLLHEHNMSLPYFYPTWVVLFSTRISLAFRALVSLEPPSILVSNTLGPRFMTCL